MNQAVSRDLLPPVSRPRSYALLLAASHLARGMALVESIFEHEDSEHRIFALCLDEAARKALATVRMPQLVALSAAELAPGADSVPALLSALYTAYPEVETLVHLASERYLFGSTEALASGNAAVELWRAAMDAPVDPGLLVVRRSHGGVEVLRAWADRARENPDVEVASIPGVVVSVDLARSFGPECFVREDVVLEGGAPFVAGRPLLSADFVSVQMFSPEFYGLVDGGAGRVSGGVYRACLAPYVEALGRAAAWERGATGVLSGQAEPTALSLDTELIAARGVRDKLAGYGLPHRQVELSDLWDAYLLADAPERSFPPGAIAKRAPCPKSVPLASSSTNSVPRVSALVSTYNAEKLIRGCLDDLIAQTLYRRGELEIVVVDSASPGGEFEIALEYAARHPNIVVVRSAEREGVYMAWNRAASIARGRFLTNANTDDRHRPDALEVLADALDANPNLALVYGDSLTTQDVNASYEQANYVGRFRWPDYEYRTLLTHSYCGPHPMWRRELHELHGWFDARYVVAADYEMWIRFAEQRPLLHIPEPLGLYTKRDDSVEHANRELCHRETMTIRALYAPRAHRPPRATTAVGAAQPVLPSSGGEAARPAATAQAAPRARRPESDNFACSIVLLLPDEAEAAQTLLETFISNTPRYIPYEVIVATRRPSEALLGVLDALGGDVRALELSPTTDTFEAFRHAGEASASEVVVLTDGHAAVAEGWLDPLLRTLELEPQAGAVAGRKVVMGATPSKARDRIGAIAVRRALLVEAGNAGSQRAVRFADAAVELFRSISGRGAVVTQVPRSSVVASRAAQSD